MQQARDKTAAARRGRRQQPPSQKKDGRKRAARVKRAIDRAALKKLNLVAVAYSHVEREWFPTEEAYEAEIEVEDRARQVIEAVEKLGIPAKGYPGDQYFLTNLLVDKPDLVINLVDTVRGEDRLGTSIPGALELTNVPYTGAGTRGLTIGTDRNMFKQLLIAADIPTPPYQFITKKRSKIEEDLGLPLIVKLNESGGSVGIDRDAVQETLEDAQRRADELISTYKIPVIVERFVDGPEVTACVFDDGEKQHVFLAQKAFTRKADGKHYFTPQESYDEPTPYTYKKVDEPLASQIEELTRRAFVALRNKDYAKFDIRVDEKTGTPYFTDANPNTAFGPHPGLPFTEVLAMHGVDFETVLRSLISKHARNIERAP